MLHQVGVSFDLYGVVLLSPLPCYNLDQDFQFVSVNFLELRVPTAVSFIEKARGTYRVIVCLVFSCAFYIANIFRSDRDLASYDRHA